MKRKREKRKREEEREGIGRQIKAHDH